MTKRANYNKQYYVLIVVVLVIILVFTYRYFHKDIRMINLPKEQQQQVTQLLESARTRCIGVYLIDLPIEFKAADETNFYYKANNNINIYTRQQYLPPFKQMITRREQELKNTKPDNPIDGDYLKAIYPLYSDDPSKMKGIIFERMEDTGTSDILRILEGYRWQDEFTLKIELKARNGLAKQYESDRKKNPESYNNNVPQKLHELRKLFERIRPRDDLTIPTEAGVCLLHGFMQGEDREWKDMTFIYRHDNMDDFYFRITSNDFAGDYALLDKPEGYVTQGRGHTIYKGTRESNDLKLEEWIAKGQFFVDEDGFHINDMGYVFTLGINMTDPTYKAPQLRIKMYYKIPKDKTQAYNEEQLKVIWREISDSIKLRQSAFKQDESSIPF